MRPARARVAMAVLTTLLVGLAAVVGGDRASPGPVAAVHARVPELEGGANCSMCHGGFLEDMTDACLDCHGPVARDLETGQGLHGHLPTAEAQRCASCHSDHHGAGFPLVHANSFARAGIPDAARFDHALLDFPFAGRHAELECTACHEHAERPLLPPGTRRFGGLSADCSRCHEDPHDGAMAYACTACHDQHRFDGPRFVDHERLFTLTGAHAGAGCRECHAAGEGRALERLGRPGPAQDPRGCADCHGDPHRTDWQASLGGGASPADASCRSCHEESHQDFAAAREVLTAEQHGATGFALEAPHATLTCEACHGAGRAPFARRFPGRPAGACALCHDDPHGGQFRDGHALDAPSGWVAQLHAGPATDCRACHVAEGFSDHGFDATRHGELLLPLDGAHAETDCHACHQHDPALGTARFADTPARCAACHVDAHDGHFASRRDPRTGDPGGDCAPCHGTTRFDEPAEPFDHGRWTGLELVGAHAEAACERCHPLAERADDSGRRFGRAHEVFGLGLPGQRGEGFGRVAGCAGCHADPHDGVFAALGPVDGRDDCARCHGQVSFRTLPGGFDHGATGFPLDGAHGETDCAACHGVRPFDGVLAFDAITPPASLGVVPGARCDACHADPHAGQFADAQGTDCSRCHDGAPGFAARRFDHDVHSRFPLDGAHRELACDACHEPVGGRGASAAVVYRPLSTDCASCHGAHAGVLLRRVR